VTISGERKGYLLVASTTPRSLYLWKKKIWHPLKRRMGGPQSQYEVFEKIETSWL